MSLFGSLYIGVSGLQTSNNALNTTAHNMSNLDTIGYTRQQVAQGTRTYVTIAKSNKTNWKQTGLGVNYTLTRQERDLILDKNYRRESGRMAFYDISASALEEIEYILGESNEGHEFAEALSGDNGFWVAVQELSKDPTSSVKQNLFVTKGYEFITRAKAVYDSLKEYQNNLNKTVVADVNKINAYAKEIQALNEKIISVEAGVENANDLRDRRNYLLDELAKLGSITYSENGNGYVKVKFEGVDLVQGGAVNEMGLYQDVKTGFYTPYWKMLATCDYNEEGEVVVTEEGIKNAKVFDLTAKISSQFNTDIGSLKSTLYARGDHYATFQEINDINKDGVYEEGWYNRNIEQSVVMNVEAEFDQLINAVVTKINDILKEAAEEAGEWPASDYLRDENGNPYQLFQKISEDGEWTTSNIIINSELRQNPSLLNFRLDEHSEDNGTMEKLKNAFEEAIYKLNPNVQTPVCFKDYYKNLVSQVANTGYVFGEIMDSQTVTVDSLFNAREQVVGVSSDEELTNMIMFQNAYNASSRYINVISEMLEHVLTTLGR